MKRIAIFLLLGPPIGLALMLVPPFAAWEQATFPNLFGLLLVLPAAYLIGGVPALIAGLIDWALAKRLMIVPRMLATTAAGYLASVLAMLATYNSSHFSLSRVFLFGVIGAVPAAVCSWLASEREHDESRTS